MSNRLVITAMPCFGRMCHIMALFEGDTCIRLQIDQPQEQSRLGSIYLGKVVKLMPEIHAAFIDIRPGESCYYSLEAHGNITPVCGQELLVQLEQEALKTKAPRVTSHLSLSGRYLVVTLGRTKLGISGKLDTHVRQTLKSWIAPLKREEYGLIVRTNAAEADRRDIEAELYCLYERMDTILLKGRTRTCYSLIEAAAPAYIREFEQIPIRQLESVITDLPQVYENLRLYLQQQYPEEQYRLRFYEDKLLALYKLYSLEHELEQACREKVWLKSGGFLIFQQTEAFVAVDVNTGKYSKKKKAEEVYRSINLEAAHEIARQLRIRNLYGIILIDFINMENPDHRDELLRVLAGCCRQDPVKTHVVDMTALQIVEITRKKTRRSLEEQIRFLKHAKEGDV